MSETSIYGIIFVFIKSTPRTHVSSRQNNPCKWFLISLSNCGRNQGCVLANRTRHLFLRSKFTELLAKHLRNQKRFSRESSILAEWNLILTMLNVTRYNKKVVASCCPQQRTKDQLFRLVDLVALSSLPTFLLYFVAFSRVSVKCLGGGGGD